MLISDWISDVWSSDLGVMFTLDTESGFRDVVFITGAYGLGETVVQGAVNPDEFYVHKQTLEAGRPASSEESSVGKECVSTCRSRWSQYHSIKYKYLSHAHPIVTLDSYSLHKQQ